MCARVLVLLAASLSLGAALKCYQCSSTHDGDFCSDSEILKGTVQLTECTLGSIATAGVSETGLFGGLGQAIANAVDNVGVPSGDVNFACQKIKYPSSSNKARVERKCAIDDVKSCSSNLGMESCSLCSYDGCNSAGHLGGGYLWLLPLLALLRGR